MSVSCRLAQNSHCEYSDSALGCALTFVSDTFPLSETPSHVRVWRTGLLCASLTDSLVVTTLRRLQLPLLCLLCSFQNVVTAVIVSSVSVPMGLCILTVFVILDVWGQATGTNECSCLTTFNQDTCNSWLLLKMHFKQGKDEWVIERDIGGVTSWKSHDEKKKGRFSPRGSWKR